MMSNLKALRTLSAHLGADPLLVQAAGGNTSIKLDGIMWIKASGTWLKDADTKDIFVPLDYARLASALATADADCESCTKFVIAELNPSGLRPSIETSVHGLMPQKVVLHVHCVNTIAWAIQQNAEALLTEILTGENWSFIPYARPGLQLAKAINQNMKPGSNVLVLGNHGLVVAAETVAEAAQILAMTVNKLTRKANHKSHADLASLLKIATGTNYQPAQNAESHCLAFDPQALAVGCSNVFYPDHVVFLGTHIPQDFANETPAIVVPRKGVLIHKSAKPAVEPMVRCLSDVFRRLQPSANLCPLNTQQIGELLNWDAEKYRQKI